MGVYFIAILGLNIVTGYTGQISLAQGAFMAIGGYTTAILVVDHGVRDLWTIPIAALVAGVAGFLVGIPALKLSGLYVALATFGLRWRCRTSSAGTSSTPWRRAAARSSSSTAPT